MTSTRRFAFALCADDYAMTPGVSRGILEAIGAGRLTATSVMTTSPWWPNFAAPLRSYEDRVDVGLHLNLTQGAPLGPMPTLAPDDRLPDIKTVMRLARSRALPKQEIAAEVDRQMARFLEVFGRAPDHVDGHQHVHALAPILALVLDGLHARGWRPWLRNSADRPDRVLARGAPLVKAIGVAVLARGLARRAARAGFAVNDGFAGFSPFDPAAAYGEQFSRYLKAPGSAHLVMCHPGYVDDALRGLDPVQDTREMELRFLLSPDFWRRLEARDATLRRLSTIAMKS